MFFLPGIPWVLFSTCFLSAQRTSFHHSFRVEFSVTNSPSFPSSGNVFLPSSFLKDHLNGYRNLGEQCFLSALEKGCAHSFWPLWFFMRNPLSFKMSSPIGNTLFLSHCFQDFFFFFNFQSLTFICFGVDYFGYLWFGVHSASMTSIPWRTFAIVLQFLRLYSFFLSLLSFWVHIEQVVLFHLQV